MPLKKLDPCSSTCERLLTYDLQGFILAVNSDNDVIHDIEQVLNLNNKALRNARKAVIDTARDKLRAEKPVQQWNKAFLQKHLEEWQTAMNGQFRIYCMAAVWFIQTLMSKPQYNK